MRATLWVFNGLAAAKTGAAAVVFTLCLTADLSAEIALNGAEHLQNTEKDTALWLEHAGLMMTKLYLEKCQPEKGDVIAWHAEFRSQLSEFAEENEIDLEQAARKQHVSWDDTFLYYPLGSRYCPDAIRYSHIVERKQAIQDLDEMCFGPASDQICMRLK